MERHSCELSCCSSSNVSLSQDNAFLDLVIVYEIVYASSYNFLSFQIVLYNDCYGSGKKNRVNASVSNGHFLHTNFFLLSLMYANIKSLHIIITDGVRVIRTEN